MTKAKVIMHHAKFLNRRKIDSTHFIQKNILFCLIFSKKPNYFKKIA